uniref:Uncharacterized protein n=1 Tax=Kapraunia schneideri TaxID=717899 RepID=A0A1Z1MSH2_9FLOR|nr:hypothetical protein [Kapraunia schneideri]ARW69018.1 hypothetical protein [Kapraunia schneideri]
MMNHKLSSKFNVFYKKIVKITFKMNNLNIYYKQISTKY